ncbi:MAG: asparagine synthase-related protein [candidate division Zixibacteria bacterium]|nr:asparagine synthase-related protein [candidate division Zixibacteria bacterium]
MQVYITKRFEESKSRDAGFTVLELNGINISYCLHPTEYLYEDDRFLVLADLNLDKTKEKYFHSIAENVVREAISGDLSKCQELLLGQYFLVIVDKNKDEVHFIRDISGVKTGFYYEGRQRVLVGTIVHDLARAASVTEFNEEAIYQILYLHYLQDGFSYYKGINEVRMGQHLATDFSLVVCEKGHHLLSLSESENGLSLDENISRLRKEIDSVHERHCSQDNVVLLSGGVDSCVMLGALADSENVQAKSFRVKGTEQDETAYAVSIAEFLGKPITIVQSNPEDMLIADQFEKWLIEMNNPYIGIWVFGNLGANSNQTYYSGQDTRLHTPNVNPIDKFAFRMLSLNKSFLYPLLKLLSTLLSKSLERCGFRNSSKRILRGLYRTCRALDLKSYLLEYYFHFDKHAIDKYHLPGQWFERIKGLGEINLKTIKNARHLYNTIVEMNWQLQYTHDMRYIQDMAKLNHTYIAMPFYDLSLARYSSTIPFKQATKFTVGHQRYSHKKTIINKFLLRSAYRDKLNDLVYYRDKATSSSFYLLFNGTVGKKIEEIIERDLLSQNSFIRHYQLEATVRQFLITEHWGIDNEEYLLLIYYIGVLCVYYQRLLKSRSCEIPRAAERI